MTFVICTITQEMNYEFLFFVRKRTVWRYRLKWVSLFFLIKKTIFLLKHHFPVSNGYGSHGKAARRRPGIDLST